MLAGFHGRCFIRNRVEINLAETFMITGRSRRVVRDQTEESSSLRTQSTYVCGERNDNSVIRGTYSFELQFRSSDLHPKRQEAEHCVDLGPSAISCSCGEVVECSQLYCLFFFSCSTVQVNFGCNTCNYGRLQLLVVFV